CASVYVHLAFSCVHAHDLPRAETHCGRALAGRPAAETHNGLGYVLSREGRDAEAVEEFRKAIDADPKFAPAYNNLADALVAQGKLAEAAEYYRRSLAQRPSAAVYQSLGVVLRKLGKTDEAAEQFSKADALNATR